MHRLKGAAVGIVACGCVLVGISSAAAASLPVKPQNHADGQHLMKRLW